MLVVGIASVHEARAGIIKSTIGLAVLGGLVYYLYNNYYLPQQAAQDQKNASLAVQSSPSNNAAAITAADQQNQGAQGTQQPVQISGSLANTGAQSVVQAAPEISENLWQIDTAVQSAAPEQSEAPVSTDVTA